MLSDPMIGSTDTDTNTFQNGCKEK